MEDEAGEAPTPTPTKRRELSPVMHFWAGGTGGMVGALVTGPLEMIKTRLQAERNKQEIRASGKRHMFGTRMLFALQHVYVTSGVTGLWRGIGPHLAGTIPARAVHFGVYNEGKRQLLKVGVEGPLQHLVAAACAGLCSVTLTSPLWVIKTRMQLQTPQEMRYKNSFDCCVKVWQIFVFFLCLFKESLQMIREEGWRAMFRGLSASILGISESTAQFVMYEEFKRLFAKGQQNGELTLPQYLKSRFFVVCCGFVECLCLVFAGMLLRRVVPSVLLCVLRILTRLCARACARCRQRARRASM
jgi:solute carrier family 25 protein 33/36